MESIKKELLKRQNSYPVNSNKESISTVNSNSRTVGEEIENLIHERGIKPEAVAMMLSEGLSDPGSLEFYKILARENNPSLLLEVLHLTKEADQLNKIRTKKPVYFLGILRKKGIVVKFKKDEK